MQIAIKQNLNTIPVKFSKSKDIPSILSVKCNHFIKIQVRDQGIGINMDAIDSLLIQPVFFTFTRLCLFMGKEFTAHIKQILWVESEMVIGSNFHSALSTIKYNNPLNQSQQICIRI